MSAKGICCRSGLHVAFNGFKLHEREVSAPMGKYVIGEVLHLAFGGVKLHELEIDSHLCTLFIISK